MSNHLDRYLLSSIPAVVNLQKTEAKTVEDRIHTAIARMQMAASDSYDQISAVSTYWALDDTGSQEDSALFLKTISKLANVETHERVIVKEDSFLLSNVIIDQAKSMTGNRKLFILHYAGHGIAGGTSDSLFIAPTLSKEENVPKLDMSYIKNGLKLLASSPGPSEGLDVLLLMDCCCASIAGRGRIKGARVELMAATSASGISNTREDGDTFTQHWCRAFNQLFALNQPFNCDDLVSCINSHTNLEQFPATFVLREGWGVPISFCAPSNSIQPTIAALTTQTVITAFHIEEDPNSDALLHLIEYLQKAPVSITVLATLPISSTLLLLRVPVFLQELLVLPRVALILTDI